MGHEKISVYCVICQAELSDERVLRKAVTCSAKHAAELKNARRHRRHDERSPRMCKLCYQPVSEEERRLFKQWRKETQGLIDKRGKARKPKAEAQAKDPLPSEITIN